jgi:hypothetical protein
VNQIFKNQFTENHREDAEVHRDFLDTLTTTVDITFIARLIIVSLNITITERLINKKRSAIKLTIV